MRSALEREIAGLCAGAASRLARHDPAVVLGVGLCFVPFPPVTLAGLLLTVLNFVLVRNDRLPKSVTPLLWTGLWATLFYTILWTAVIFWLVHTGGLSAVIGWLHARGLWLWHGFHATPAPPPGIQQI